MMEQQRISGRKSYHKLLGHTKSEERACVVCGADISDLRGNRVVCRKPECKEVIVKRTKNAYYERNHGTLTDMERRRQATARYRAKHRPAITARKTTARPTQKPKPARPVVNTRYQRKPRESMKFTILPRKEIKPSPVVEDDAPWTPKVHNLPESMTTPSVSDPTRRRSTFSDPWNCGACRAIEAPCRLHQSIAADGIKPLIRSVNV
jgi:hypothetical protein